MAQSDPSARGTFKQIMDEEIKAAYEGSVRDMNRYHPKPGPPPTRLQKIKSKWFWLKYGGRKRLAEWIDPDA